MARVPCTARFCSLARSLARSLAPVRSQGNSDEFEGRAVARFVLSRVPALIHPALITPRDPRHLLSGLPRSLSFRAHARARDLPISLLCLPVLRPSPLLLSACLPSLAPVRYFQREFESMTECLNVLLSRWPINAARRCWYRVTMSSCMYVCTYIYACTCAYMSAYICAYVFTARVSISAAWPRCGERDQKIGCWRNARCQADGSPLVVADNLGRFARTLRLSLRGT
jgi:hypothetical protein